MVCKASFHPVLELPCSSVPSQPSSTPGLCTAVLSLWPAHKCSPGSLFPCLYSSGSTVFLKVPSPNTLSPFFFLCVIKAGCCAHLPPYFRAGVIGAGLSNSHRIGNLAYGILLHGEEQVQYTQPSTFLSEGKTILVLLLHRLLYYPTNSVQQLGS